MSQFWVFSTNLYNNVTTLYPHANIWLTGHSLGGAIASLLGTTFGAPTVAFESPGDRMAAARLHLPLPPPLEEGELGALTHVYHNAGEWTDFLPLLEVGSSTFFFWGGAWIRSYSNGNMHVGPFGSTGKPVQALT